MSGVNPIEHSTIVSHGEMIGITDMIRFVGLVSAMCLADRDHASKSEAKPE